MDVNGWVFMAWRFWIMWWRKLEYIITLRIKLCLRGIFQDGHGVAVGFVVNDDD